MEDALGAIRLYAKGQGSESEVFRCALLVPGWVASGSAKSEKSTNGIVGEADTSINAEATFVVGQLVQRRDDGEHWGTGYVVSVDPLTVTVSEDSSARGCSWGEVRQIETEVQGEAPEDGDVADAEVTALEKLAAGTEVSELFSWGKSSNYQLGYACTQVEQNQPRPVPLWLRQAFQPSQAAQIKTLSCGRFHSVAVTGCGCVFSWGFGGARGSLGFEPSNGAAATQFVVEPMQLPEFGPGRHCAVKPAVGMSHSMVLTNDGRILSWGSNSHGQLGLQGSPVGPDVHVRRPCLLKSALKTEEVLDIAAGAEHSLCVVARGAAFSWGSNAHGGLGLGLPPAGPAEAAHPQELPHVRGAWAVAASPSGHVSVVLAAHGDAVIFGCPLPADSRGSSATSRDPKFYVPSRVHRREKKGSGKDKEWEIQRGTLMTLPPLRSVAVGFAEGFGIDAAGTIWAWTLQGPRPCVAETLNLSIVLATGSSKTNSRPQAPAVAWSTIAASSESLWASDASPASSLWRLQRLPAADKNCSEPGEWEAERVEKLTQVSLVVAGPEHQMAIVKYWRPPPPSAGKVEEPISLSEPLPDEESDSENVTQRQQPVAPPSLQELCENKLLKSLSPSTFPLICEIAWEFRRPKTLDCAYSFLRKNASLMFMRTNLPTLAQLPVGALAAFELTEAGLLASPSAALALDPWDFPPEEWRQVHKDDPTEVHMGVLTGAGQADEDCRAAVASVRKGRRAGRGVNTRAGAPKAATPKSSQPAPKATPTGESPALLPAAARAVPLAWHLSQAKTGATTSPKVGCEPALLNQALTGVNSRLAKELLASLPLATTASGKASPNFSTTGTPKSAPNAKASPKCMTLENPTLLDFLRPKHPSIAYGSPSNAESTLQAASNVAADRAADFDKLYRKSAALAEGPSSTLTAALESAGETKGPWTMPDDVQDNLVSMKEILAESKNTRRRGPISDDPLGEKTRCSWGSDVQPSILKKNSMSIAEAQQQEKLEQSIQKDTEEMLEIEMMFEALRVAELAEQMELEGGAATSVEKQGPRKAAASARGRAQGGKGGSGRKSAGVSEGLQKEASKDSKGGGAKGSKGGDGGGGGSWKGGDGGGGRRWEAGEDGGWKGGKEASKGQWRQRKSWQNQGWNEWWGAASWWEGSHSRDSNDTYCENKSDKKGQGRGRNNSGRGGRSGKGREVGEDGAENGNGGVPATTQDSSQHERVEDSKPREDVGS